MRAIILAILVAGLIIATEAKADNYGTYHTALEAAVNEQLEPFGIACDVVRRGYWQIEAGAVSQPKVTVSCVQVAAADDSVTVSWQHPTTRSNGEPLGLDEIAGYEIRYRSAEGVVWTELPVVDSYELKASSGFVAIRTVDTNGLVSRLSEEVAF